MTNEDNPLQYLAKCKHELLHKVLVGTERSNSEKYCLNTMGSSKSISLLQTCSISAQQIQCSKSDVPSLFSFAHLGDGNTLGLLTNVTDHSHYHL